MLGLAPIDVRDVVARRGVQLVVHPLPEEWGDGRYIKKGSRELIVANSTTGDAGRIRFTVAHELGHHELHRFGRDFVVQIDYDIYAPNREKPRVEKEADAFAAYLLAPTDALQRDLANVQPRQITPEIVVKLMRRYGLSYTSLVYRLHNAGLIGATVRDRLIREGQGQIRLLQDLFGRRDDEHFFRGRQLPDEYEAAALKLYEHRHIALPRLAEMLRMSEGDAEVLVRRLGIERAPGLEPDESAVEALLQLAEDA